MGQKRTMAKKCQEIPGWHYQDKIVFYNEKIVRFRSDLLQSITKDKLAIQRFQNASAVMV